MIEIKQGGKKENQKKDSEERTVSCQPKNFRQIGSPQGNQKVYIEDYVYTYLHPMFEAPEEMRVCILLGRIEKEDDIHYIFVSGAVELSELEFAGTTPVFLEKTREEICTLIKKHFDGSYLVGWYLDLKGNMPKLTPELERIHRNFFGGRDKIFFLSDSLNREEKLFACDNNAIWQKEGYYIYYEKNPAMQEYMIGAREHTENTVKPEQVVDDALKNYREMLLQKDEEKPRRFHVAFYSTAFLLVLTVCVLGVNMLNNYEKMRKLEGAISVLSDSVETESQEEKTEVSGNRVIIKSIDGNVEKIETESERKSDGNQNVENREAAQNADGQSNEAPQSQEGANSESAQGQDTQGENQTGENGEGDAAAMTDTEKTAGVNNSDTKQDSENEPVETAGELTEAETIRLQGYYIVQKGDNLASIIRKIYGDMSNMEAVCEKNGIDDSNQIYAGQKLILP